MKLGDLGYTSIRQFLNVLFSSLIKVSFFIIIGFLLSAYIFNSYEITHFLIFMYATLSIFFVIMDVIHGAPKQSFLVDGICTITKQKEECNEKCGMCMKNQEGR